MFAIFLKSIDSLYLYLYNHFEIKKSRMWLPSLTYDKEVVCMIEQALLSIIMHLFVGLIVMTIIAVALIIAMVIIMCK